MQKIQTMNVFQQGLIWGAVLGIFDIIMKFISFFTVTNFFSNSIFLSIITTVSVVVYVFIGLRASQVTGRVGTGALVGFFTGLFASIIGLIGTIITTFTNADKLLQQARSIANNFHLSGDSAAILLLLLILVTAVLGGLILAPSLGALAGAIGGTIGKRRAKN